jgi:hypothetical protein
MNAFAILGFDTRLTLHPEELGDAFREAGKSLHPDAGGDEAEFARLREAHAVLASPSRRLKHWLELQNIAVETRGAVDPRVMDLFATVGEVTQRAESLVRRRQETKTPLGLAMLEHETQLCRESVERAISMVEAAITGECAAFPEYETADSPDTTAASTTARNLAFLEKWQATLRSLYARLV